MFKTKISKACQECRKRKIRCDGQNPCSACQRRNTVCQFRERARVRKPTAESSSNHASDQEEKEKENEIAVHHQPQSHLYRDVHRSVSARHRSSSDSVELYYGPTSDFSLLQHLYHSLYLNAASRHDRDDSDEVDQGLDFFRVRHIFFGPAATAFGADTPGAVNLPLPPAHIAHALMNRFLATHYNVVPFYSKSRYDQLLGALYNDPDNSQYSQVQKQICLLAIATAAANTEHFEWGATISQYCQAQYPKMQYTVSLERIQLGILMLECAHSNIAYMTIGDTCRKAFAAGLHRQQSRANPDDNQGALERHHTFWSLYFMEIWVSFFLGRPSMLEYFKAEVPEPQDIFLSTLVQFAQVMLTIVQQIYRSQCAPSVLWNSAMTVGREMNALQSTARSVFGIELDAPRISDPRGMRPTILITLYNFMSLLIFRPFVIIRGKLQHPQQEVSESATSRTPDIPSWLNDACHKCLHAARSIIIYTCHIAAADPLLLELRFNCFYLDNSLFLLLYDMASNPENRDHNLPLIHSGLRFLANMRPGDPVCSSIATIRRILQHMNLDAGPGELIQHAPPSHGMGFDPLASNSPPAPASQMSMYPSPWEEQPPPQQVEESGVAAGNDFQFDLDFSAADFNVDITAIDWGTFFSYVPS